MATPPLRLTRDQLASFLQDHQQIRAFENLFGIVEDISIAGVDAEVISGGIGQQRASEALNAIQRLSETLNLEPPASDADIQRVLELLNKQPPQAQSKAVDYFDFNRFAPKADARGRVGWNNNDDTLEIGHEYGVVQQVGQEYYARVENMTGSLIPNGTVVGFAGVGANNVISIAPYLADGSSKSLYILGVLTHDLPDSGEVGFCTTWGNVRGINTTGTPVLETWNAGDILYASPTTAGAFTNVKPTAPDNVIPVAAVLFVDATDGEIFVRPTIEQQQYYGEFTKTGASTSPAVANTSYAVSWDNTEIANGVSIVSGSQLTVVESGLYQFDVTLQLQSNSGVDKNVRFWFKKNGTNIPNTTRLVTVSVNNAYTPLSLADFFSLDAGDYVELWWQADSTNVALVTVAAGGTAPNDYPAAPAGIIAVTQIQL